MGDELEPEADPDTEMCVDPELERYYEEQAQAERDIQRAEMEAQIAELKEQQQLEKDWSRIDSYVSKPLVFVGGGLAVVGGPPGVLAGLIVGGGGLGFDMLSTYRANEAADIGDEITQLEKKLEKM